VKYGTLLMSGRQPESRTNEGTKMKNPTMTQLEITAHMATEVLNDKLELYRKAQDMFNESRGTLGEAEALAFGKKVFAEYETMKKAYALIGLTDLGIHNNK
jgi:hypothetical protein